MHRFKQLGPINSYVILPILVVYFSLVILLPANTAAMQTYHLTTSTYHILLFIVQLPLIATWLAAFYGYYKLRQYTLTLSGTPEEKGFVQLTRGFQWLAWSLVIPMFWTLISGGIANKHPNFHPTATIIGNYAYLFFPLLAYTWVANGAEALLTHSGHNSAVTRQYKPVLALFAILGALYGYLAFRQLDLGSPQSANNQYFLPAWLLITTIVIPYLYAWFIGLSGAFMLTTIAKHTKGVLYHQGLTLIAGGVTLVIASSIGAQCIRSVIPHSGHLALNFVLVVIYLFYLIIILGFGLIGLGAHRLKKIEDI